MTDLVSSRRAAAPSPNLAPPMPKRIPTALTIHGETRQDDYFWLRDKADPDVMAQLEAENAYTDALMAPTRALQTALYDEMLSHIRQTDMSAPYWRRGYSYYTRTVAGQQYAVHCRRAADPAAAEEVLLDLNELALGKAFLSLRSFEVSDDGTLLAYSLDDTGYRQFVLAIKDLRSGVARIEPIERVHSVVWAADNRTLIYATEDAVTKRADSVWRRDILSDAATRIYHEADELFDVSVERTRDGAFILIRAEAKDTSDVRFLAADEPTEAPRLFHERSDGIECDLDHRAGTFYIRTNEGAPDFRVFTTAVATPARGDWVELIEQRVGVTITGIDLFADFVVVAGRRDGLPSLELLVGESTTLTPLEFAESDYVVRVGQNADFVTPTFRFTYESLVTPPTVYDLHVASGERRLIKQLDVPDYDPTRYRAERVFMTATDGTPIPISIVRRADVADRGAGPMLLYAYGSYGISVDATFAATRLPLLDRGVSFAIAHLRGGGEYGEAWRLAGNLFAKRTTFTDFIDCACGLVAAGYTTPEQLVIQGGSAGGLLMGAVVNMRPDLFAAAIVAVPFVDVLTTMLDASLPLTTGEYREWGNPNEIAAYEYMRSYSPVDNVRAQPYPRMLIEVALYDSQVPYWEGVKFAAKLREVTTSANPILVKVNLGAGHSGASGRYDALKERAFDYAFVLSAVGMSDGDLAD